MINFPGFLIFYDWQGLEEPDDRVLHICLPKVPL